MFTVVIQKGWKLMAKNNECESKEKEPSPSVQLRLLALEAVVIVVMIIKLQTPMKVYIAVIAI